MHEFEILDACLRNAWRLAGEGRLLEGYAELDLGLTWAETPALNPFTGEVSEPDPWSEALIALYREALVRYVAEHPAIEGVWEPVRRVTLEELSRSLAARRIRWRTDRCRVATPSVRRPVGRVRVEAPHHRRKPLRRTPAVRHRHGPGS